MRHDHLKKELDLLLMLTQNRSYTVEDICNKMEVSRRNLYYYLDFFRNAGFIVEKNGRMYSISRESEFFSKLYDMLLFTDEEAMLIRQLIDSNAQKTIRMKSLKEKLETFYDFNVMDNESTQSRVTRTMQRLVDAVKNKKTVKLIGYSSPNSHSVRDRIVEPFLFMNNQKDIRCYEIESGKNKTFRLSRMEGVEILNNGWLHEEEHRRVYTDLFMFSGEERMTVTLTLGQLSRNLMLEEYPLSAPCMAEQPDGRWLFVTEVCSYLGIGRFVMGLLEDIEVKGDEGFIKYLKEKTNNYLKRL